MTKYLYVDLSEEGVNTWQSDVQPTPYQVEQCFNHKLLIFVMREDKYLELNPWNKNDMTTWDNVETK